MVAAGFFRCKLIFLCIMGKISVYGSLAQVLSYGICDDAPLVCCHECECVWSGGSECFLCGELGEVLAVPKKFGDMSLVSETMLSDCLVVVSSDLALFLQQERSRLTRRSAGMEI
jgi:hypothetical protein